MALLEATLYCPNSFSLKDKRQEIQSLLDSVRGNFNVSTAEVDHQEHHRLSTVAFCAVGSSQPMLNRLLDQLEEEITRRPVIQVRELSRRVL